MKCKKCGAALLADSVFCDSCGEKIEKTFEKSDMQRTGTSEYSNVFVNQSEQLVDKFGRKWFGVSPSLNKRNVSCLLTNERLYFRGCSYDISKKRLLSKTNREVIVDLDDITGSGIITSNHIAQLVIGIIFSVISVILFIGYIVNIVNSNSLFVAVPCLVIGGIFLLVYFLTRKCIFFIQYAGGGFSFNIKNIGVSATRKFHMSIQKEKYKKKSK